MLGEIKMNTVTNFYKLNKIKMEKFNYDPDDSGTMEEQISDYEDHGNDKCNEQMLEAAIEERETKIKIVRAAYPERPDLFAETLQIKTSLTDSQIMDELFKHYSTEILSKWLIIKKSNP